MKQIKIFPALLIAAFSLLFGQYTTLGEANANTATRVGNWLKIGTSVRANSMGGAAVANTKGIAGIPYNSAGLTLMPGSEVYFTTTNYLAGITYNVVSYGTKLSPFDYFGFHLFWLDSGPIDVTNIWYPLGTGEKYSVNSLSFRVAYARRITDRLRAGLAINYIREDIYTTTMKTLAFDAGLLLKSELLGTFGLNIGNLGPEAQFHGPGLEKTVVDTVSADERLSGITHKFSLPTVIRVGIKHDLIGPDSRLIKIASQRLTVALDGIQAADYALYGNVGMEYGFLNLAFIRLGSYLGHDTAELSAGAGLAFRMGSVAIKADYAFVDFGILKPVHQVAIGIEF